MMTMQKIVLLSILISLAGCFETPDFLLLKKARQAENSKEANKAIHLYKKAIEETSNDSLKIKASWRIVDIYRSLSKYKEIRKFLSLIILTESREGERKKAKQELADNEFFNIKNYRQAVREYSHLVEVGYQVFINRLMIAKSYFHLNNLSQSKHELKELLNLDLPETSRFDALLLLGNVYFADKRYQKSTTAYLQLIEKYPEAAKKNYVLLNLAMSFEEDREYKKAVESLRELQAYYHTPEFIAAKIQHIENKMRHMPGARGLRK